MLTNLERAQMTEIEARLCGYRRMANDSRSTNADRRLAISQCKEFQRQIAEIQSRVTYRELDLARS
jgi:hypothetical protein